MMHLKQIVPYKRKRWGDIAVEDFSSFFFLFFFYRRQKPREDPKSYNVTSTQQKWMKAKNLIWALKPSASYETVSASTCPSWNNIFLPILMQSSFFMERNLNVSSDLGPVVSNINPTTSSWLTAPRIYWKVALQAFYSADPSIIPDSEFFILMHVNL